MQNYMLAVPTHKILADLFEVQFIYNLYLFHWSQMAMSSKHTTGKAISQAKDFCSQQQATKWLPNSPMLQLFDEKDSQGKTHRLGVLSGKTV